MLGPGVNAVAPIPALETLLEELSRVRDQGERLRAESTMQLLQLEARARELQAQIAEATTAAATVPLRPLALVPPSPIVVDVKRKKPRQERKDHPAPRLIGNVAQWCREQKPPVTRAAFRSWYVEGEPYSRAVPDRIRRQLYRTHGVPLNCWGNGVTEADYQPRPPKEKAQRPK